MANENDAGTVAETDTEQMNRFAGFSVKDGVRDEPATKTVEGKAAPAAKTVAKDPAKVDGEDGDEKDAEKHRSAQSRIDKAVGKQRDAERRATAAETRANNLEQRLAGIEARLTPANGGGKGAAVEGEPDPKKYEGGEFDTRYIRDLARYEAKQATKEIREESRDAASSQQAQAAAAEFQGRIDEFTEKATDTYEDFAEVVFDESNKFSTTVVELSLESEHGAQIAYELALDPKEQRRLAGLTPAQQAKWFGKREIELESSKTTDGEQGEGEGAEKPAAKGSKAPPPPKHQTRGNGGTGGVSAATDDFAAFERMAMGTGRK